MASARTSRADIGGLTISDEKSGTDLVIVTGWTDGGYPAWIGRTDAGVSASVVVDFMAPGLHEATPV